MLDDYDTGYFRRETWDRQIVYQEHWDYDFGGDGTGDEEEYPDTGHGTTFVGLDGGGIGGAIPPRPITSFTASLNDWGYYPLWSRIEV